VGASAGLVIAIVLSARLVAHYPIRFGLASPSERHRSLLWAATQNTPAETEKPRPIGPGLLVWLKKKQRQFGRWPYLTVTVTVVGCVTPPDVPAIVMVKVPVAARRLTVTVIFDVVLPVIEVGPKPKVTLFSWPVAESAIVGVPLVTCALIVARRSSRDG